MILKQSPSHSSTQWVNSLIASLKISGGQTGEILGIASWNCHEYLDVVGAAMKGGFIASPYNPKLNKNGYSNLINYSKPLSSLWARKTWKP
jgi:acyl-CoA synthetase (AMP-forming)/AMP-acid ligase II